MTPARNTFRALVGFDTVVFLVAYHGVMLAAVLAGLLLLPGIRAASGATKNETPSWMVWGRAKE